MGRRARAFLRAPTSIFGLIGVGLIVVIGIIAPTIWGHSASTENPLIGSLNPSWSHPFGTNQLGEDIFAQVLVATRNSVGHGLIALGIGVVLGSLLGLSAAFVSPRVRPVLLRTIDMMIAFPTLIVAIFVASMTGPGSTGPVIGVGIGVSAAIARVVSTLALSVGGREYVQAAQTLGLRKRVIWVQHILPNIGDILIVLVAFELANSIVALAGVSFLGLGVQPPGFDWGSMITVGIARIYTAPVATLGPAAAIIFAAVTVGLFGEGVARSLNPQLWTTRSLTPEGGSNSDFPASNGRVAALVDGLQEAGEEDVLQVEHLRVAFATAAGRFDAVNDISFSVGAAERVGIVGESGSGKSMTALAIAQLVAFPGVVSGSIRLRGRELGSLAQSEKNVLLKGSLAFVFQDPMSSLNPALRIRAQMTEAIVGGSGRRGDRKRTALARAIEGLNDVGIPTAERTLGRYPHELSGGMRQRVMIAMGLMHEPALLIADEPTTALDVTVQAQVMDVLDRVNQEHGTAVILISHNMALVKQNSDRVLVMYAGRIVEEIRSADLVTDARHPYTRALLEAVPDLSQPVGAKLKTIPGEPVSAAEMTSGCAFRTRCPLAFDRCTEERPPLVVTGDHGSRAACWKVAEVLASEDVAVS